MSNNNTIIIIIIIILIIIIIIIIIMILIIVISFKKEEKHANTISWIRSKFSFALIRSALLCLRGSRSTRRTFDTSNVDFNLENVIARLN